ncbi:MAG: NAD-dependent dehydratase [Parachlamydiales bacterium]|nr:NAD-dependent dehydratase [Parachlamydiales bacterium]
MIQKTALVCGAGGFIGYHLVKRYKEEGYWVRGVDIRYPEFGTTLADEFIIADLRYPDKAKRAVSLKEKSLTACFDEVCQLAANMGGIGFISQDHSAEILHDSAMINLCVLDECRKRRVKKILYTSSACIYPLRNQMDPAHPQCSETSAYPADPDTAHGWETLFGEQLYLSYIKDYNMDIRIVRLHNVFGPMGPWRGGREKAPAALCRKIAEAPEGGSIQLWGKGDQTRSFLDIDECIEGLRRIMLANKTLPILNLGSDKTITINNLALLIARISGKQIELQQVPGPRGVRGRTSDNTLILKELNWQPSQELEVGLRKLYPWIAEQIKQQFNVKKIP